MPACLQLLLLSLVLLVLMVFARICSSLTSSLRRVIVLLVCVQPDMTVGHCWPMVGRSGLLAIRLSHPIRVSAVTIDHLPKEIANSRDPSQPPGSAPRRFRVYGLPAAALPAAEEGQGLQGQQGQGQQGQVEADADAQAQAQLLAHRRLLGSFEYDAAGPATQTFHVLPRGSRPGPGDSVFPAVQLEVLDNHGHPAYTCLYRFRVHGAQ